MEIYEVIKEFLKPELLILIPVLYLFGLGIKKTSIQDPLIPFLLGLASIILCGLYVFASSDIITSKDVAMAIFTSITQGILISGCSVYFNQLYKQFKKLN